MATQLPLCATLLLATLGAVACEPGTDLSSLAPTPPRESTGVDSIQSAVITGTPLEMTAPVLVKNYQDCLGHVSTRMWYCETKTAGDLRTGTCPLGDPANYVAVGGGARALGGENFPGAFLVDERVPTLNRDSFQASSKAHVQSQPHKLGVYVIGLKIEGVPRAQLLSNISEVTAQSDRSETPQVQLTLPPGRLLLGGYVFSQWVQGATSGQLLEGSWGTTSGGYWKAKTRDHIDIDSLKITVSLAHIPSSIGGVQLQSVELGAAVASPSGIGQAIVDFKFAALT